jgi:tetratricopeptide (TPR) repeat protein
MSEHELWNELGKIYFNTGAFDAAISAYTRAIELNPEFGLPYSNLALAYVQKGKYPEALSYYRKSISLMKENKARAIAWNRLGDMYRQLKDYDNAVSAFRKADELDLDLIMLEEAPEPLRKDLDSGIDLVMRKETEAEDQSHSEPPIPEGSLTGTVPDNQAPLEESSSSIEAEESLHFSKGIPRNTSCETIEEELEINPEAEDVYLEPALFNVNTETPQWHPLEDIESTTPNETIIPEATIDEEESSETADLDESEEHRLLIGQIHELPDTRPLTPTDLPVYSDQGEELRLAGIFPEEIPLPNPAALADHGNTHQSGAHSDSTGKMEEMLASQPILAPDEQAELERDIANMKRVLEINPRNAFGWDSLGKLYKSAGQYDDAISAYEHAIDLDPMKSFYHYNLGLVYAAKKEFEKAIQIFQNVIELSPDYALAHATIAGCYRRLGLEEDAQKHIKIASLSIQDENEYNLACFEAICGNVDHSIELLRASLARNQVSLEWVRRDPDLDFVREDPRYAELMGKE